MDNDLKSIAISSLKKADGIVLEAAKIMENVISRDEKLYRELMNPLLSTACYDAVSAVHRIGNKIVWKAPNYTAGGNGSRVHALASSNLLLFALPDGTPLGEATKDQVLKAADFYGKQAKDMTVKSVWLSRIGGKLTGKKTVSKVFTSEALRALQAEVQNAK